MNRNGFDIGEYVSYGINGMCNIEDIKDAQERLNKCTN